MKRLLLTGAILAFALPAAAQHAAHEHGVAELNVAMEGKRLVIELESPLDNLVGFEHAPGNEAQRKALADAEQRLRGFTGLFALPSAAGCKLKSVELESPYPQGARGEAGHGHGEEQEGGHAEIHVSYELECADPAAVKEIGVALAEAFPRMQRIRAATAGERGQAAVTLDKSRRTLPL